MCKCHSKLLDKILAGAFGLKFMFDCDSCANKFMVYIVKSSNKVEMYSKKQYDLSWVLFKTIQ